MSKYVTTKRYRAVGLCDKELNIRYGTPVEENGGILYFRGDAICAVASENGFRHFSWDEDGRGKERGAITQGIAYGDKGSPVALSDEENALFREKWGAYLRDLSDTNIPNADFFKAPVETLEEIAADLHFVCRDGAYSYSGKGPTPIKPAIMAESGKESEMQEFSFPQAESAAQSNSTEPQTA